MRILEESWVDQYPIHSYEVDHHSRLTLVSATNYFQESDWRNAEALGLGFKELASKNRFWILSRLYIEMYSYPLWGETIQLETWPKGMESLFALRDFRIKSADGNVLLGAGATAWLIIDGTTHRLQRIEQVCTDMPCYPQNAVEHKLEKIVSPTIMTAQVRIIAGYADIDVNNHVNNVSYLNWALNYLPLKSENLNVRSAELNFLSEARLHSPIEIFYGNENEQTYICSLRNPDNGKEYCKVRIVVN